MGACSGLTKELLYPFQFAVKVLQRRQGRARVRDVLKANEVIDEINHHYFSCSKASSNERIQTSLGHGSRSTELDGWQVCCVG